MEVINIKLSKILTPDIIQSRGFLDRLLGILMKVGLMLMKKVPELLTKSVLKPLGLISSASAADIGIHKLFLD